MDRPARQLPPSRNWRLRVAAGLLLAAAIAWLGVSTHRSELASIETVNGRFQLRVEMAELFLREYVRDVLNRERNVAQQSLASPRRPEQTELDTVVEAFGFEAAVLVDGSGKLIQVYPSRPDLVGVDVAARYVHLRDALSRGTAISAVVPSAARGAPIVAFAARYPTTMGWRVFSGAYDVSRTPLRAYLGNLSPIPGAAADLVDSAGAIVTSSRWTGSGPTALARIDPHLADALGREKTSGVYAGMRGSRHFVAREVEGTPWRLVVSVDEAAMYAGTEHARQWILFGALALAMLLSGFSMVRLIEHRAELRAMNADLDRIARVDLLTNVPNRRHMEEQLTGLTSGATRHKQPLSVLIIDVDYFKRVNDQYGHAAGDKVLQILAARVSGTLRVEDVFGRWGGEEFLALLPNTTAAGAALAAERIRLSVRGAPVPTSLGDVRVTISIGCASSTDPSDQTLVAQADVALYRAKQLGRDRVIGSDITSAARTSVTG